MSERGRLWSALAAVALAELGALALGGAWLLGGGLPSEVAPRVLAALSLAALAALAGLAALGVYLERALLGPVRGLARSAHVLARANPAHAPELPASHLLGELPRALASLGAELDRARHEVVRALETGAGRAAVDKARLETVLRELSEGVVVCDADARILLYNPAAMRILGASPAFGLGRSLYTFVARAPLEHSLWLLERGFEAQAEEGAAAAKFVCTGAGDRLLRCHLRPFPGGEGQARGFVLAFEDATGAIEALERRENLLRQLLEELPGPLASLRAAGESLAAHPGMTADKRRRFESIVVEESVRLSERLRAAAEESRGLVGSGLTMGDVHSVDLAEAVARRLREHGGPRIVATGLPLWLNADAHALALALERLAVRLREATGRDAFDLEAGPADRRIDLELVWPGRPIAESTLAGWLDEPLAGAVGALTLRDVVRLHGGALWSGAHRRGGRAYLRLPVPASPRSWQRPEPLPARPEFYDFELGERGRALGEMGERPLAELEYVVFDTETTGLKPSAGDEIVAIGAVRIVNGRILSGETFERLVHPGRSIPRASVRFHGVSDERVKGKPPIEVVLPQFRAFVGDAVLVAHNAAFDMKFLRLKQARAGVRFDNPVLDTLLLSVSLHDHAEDHTLEGIAARLGVEIAGRHAALGDAFATAEIFLRLVELLAARGVGTLAAALEISERAVEVRKRQAEF